MIRSRVLQHILWHFIVYEARRFLLVLMMSLSLLFLYMSPNDKFSNFTFNIAGNFIQTSFNVYSACASRVNALTHYISVFKDLHTENQNLKLEISTLKEQIEYHKNLEAENAELKKLLPVTNNIAKPQVIGRLLSVVNNPFSKIGVINVGKVDGIKKDQIVVSHEGFLGKVSEVSDHYAKVMLIGDFNVRIAVSASLSKARGVLVGSVEDSKIKDKSQSYNHIKRIQKSELLEVLYLNEDHSIKIGENLVTTGDGEMYPAGIPVAKVVSVGQEQVIAKPIANLSNTDLIVIY